MSAFYTGPQCPLCSAPLDLGTIRPGLMQCSSCRGSFEATPFRAVEPRHDAVQAVTATPDGVAAACANHARNAAVTSCQRCGLFICALCEMNIGNGAYCPSCFDRIRTEGALQTRYRDYATMSVSAAVVGLLCMSLPIGPFVIYWGIKGLRQRRSEGRGIAAMVTVLVFGALETLGFLSLIGLMIFGIVSEGMS